MAEHRPDRPEPTLETICACAEEMNEHAGQLLCALKMLISDLGHCIDSQPGVKEALPEAILGKLSRQQEGAIDLIVECNRCALKIRTILFSTPINEGATRLGQSAAIGKIPA